MSLLTMVERATRMLGIRVPTSVVGNTDRQIVQLLELAQTEGEELSARKPDWSMMNRENTFTQVAAKSQGALNSDVVSDGDFDFVLNDTMWNRTLTLPILGPVAAGDWQSRQALGISGVFQEFRIQEGNLYFFPDGANATDTIAFEYHSTSWCESAGGSGQALWAADTDVGLLDETLMRLGLIWRWKAAKGLDYLQDFENYERRVTDAMGRDGGAARLDLGGRSKFVGPGVTAPLGSWSL